MLAETVLSLSLVCDVAFTVTDTTSSSTQLDYGRPPISTQTEMPRRVTDRLFVELGPGRNRIRLPRQLSRPNEEGWRDLKELAVADQAIDAKFTFYPTVGGSITINRMNGEVRARWGNLLFGSNSLAGDCRPYEAPTTRLF